MNLLVEGVGTGELHPHFVVVAITWIMYGAIQKLTKKDVNFIWDKDCQQAFEVLKKTLVDAPILVWLNFHK